MQLGVNSAKVGDGQNPHPDSSIGELSVFGSREGAAAAVFQGCARQVEARGRLHFATFYRRGLCPSPR
eukprot:2276256-Pyramimonas_sp.AAC.1